MASSAPLTVFEPDTMLNFTSLNEILDEAAAGTEIRRYLELRGIRTIGTFALVSVDEEAFQRTIVDPLLAGFATSSERINIPDGEKPIARAVLLHSWTLARTSWNKTLASAHAVAPAVAPSPTSTPATTSATDTKVPKNLPPGKWSELVEAFNKITVNGRPRQFPVRELLGAEMIVARLWHERHISKQYTPLQLGELLQHRSFTASGEINPLARNPKKCSVLSLDEERQLVENDDPTWTPRSLLSVLDGLQAAKWAYVLVQLGDETDISEFIEAMVMRARSKSDKMAQFVIYWHAAMWRVAMDMRGGDSFGVAAFYHDYISKDPPVDKSKINKVKTTEVVERPLGKGSKGGKVGKGSQHQSDRWQPYPRPRWQESSSWRSPTNSWQSRSQQSNQWHRDYQQQQSWNDRYNK